MHRDLKPSNIFFACDQVESDETESDSLKVGDFGLVTHWEQTIASDISGKPQSNLASSFQHELNLYHTVASIFIICMCLYEKLTH